MSRGIRILIGVAAVAYIAALVLVVYTLAEQQSADTRITKQEKFDPCVSLSEAVANKASDRINPLTRECREFLNGIGPLVTIKLSCAIIEKARYICPAPGTGDRRTSRHQGEGNTPLGPALTAEPSPTRSNNSQSKTGGKQETPDETKTGHKPSKQPPHSGSPPATAPEASPAPSQPGNSGNGASAEHGVKACVDLAVSACVKTELP